MEEKKKFLPKFDNCIYDSENCLVYDINHRFIICNLLNQQDKRIKELEEALKNEEQLHDLCIEDNEKDKDFLRKQIKYESDARNRFSKENQQLKQQLEDIEKRYKKAYQEGLLQKQFDKDMEITELKQQLHDLPKKIVEDIKNGFNEKIKDNGFNSAYGIDLFWLNNFLDTILKKCGGGNE